jgi:hypothetical protein
MPVSESAVPALLDTIERLDIPAIEGWETARP